MKNTVPCCSTSTALLLLGALLASWPTEVRADRTRRSTNGAAVRVDAAPEAAPAARPGPRSRSVLVGFRLPNDSGVGGGLRIELGLFAPPAAITSTLGLGIDLGLAYSATGRVTSPGTVVRLSAPCALVAAWRLELGPIGLGVRGGIRVTPELAATVRDGQAPRWDRHQSLGGVAGVTLWLPARTAGLFGGADLLLGRGGGLALTAGIAL